MQPLSCHWPHSKASLPYTFDDFNAASEQIKSAFKIFSVNVNDTVAYNPLLRSAVSTFKAIETANEERIKSDVVSSVLQYNLALANAWLLNTDEALVYYSKFKANKRSASAPGLIEILQRTISFMQKREAGVKSGYSGNLLEKITASKQ